MRRMLECNPVINLFSTYYSPSLKDFLTFYPKSRPDAWLSFQADFLSKNLLFQQTKKTVKTQDFQRLKILKIRLFIEPKTHLYWAILAQKFKITLCSHQKWEKFRLRGKLLRSPAPQMFFLAFILCLTNFLGSHLLCNNFILSRFTRIHYLHYGVKSLTQRVLSFFVFFFLDETLKLTMYFSSKWQKISVFRRESSIWKTRLFSWLSNTIF